MRISDLSGHVATIYLADISRFASHAQAVHGLDELISTLTDYFMNFSCIDQYQNPGYDGLVVLPQWPMADLNPVDYGLQLGDTFDPSCATLPQANLNLAAVGCQSDLPIEFYKLQRAYFESQLAISQEAEYIAASHQAQHMTECQAQAMQCSHDVNHANLHDAQVPLGGTTLQEGDFPSAPLGLETHHMMDRVNTPPEQARHPPPPARTTPIKKEGVPVVRKSSSASSRSSERSQRQQNPDRVPLYSPDRKHAEAAVSELREMEEGFRAETSRRISQVAVSQMN